MPTRLKALLLLAASMLVPPLAQAHAILEESTPAAGATVKPGAIDLRFRYNSRIDRSRSRLTLIRADHSRETIPIVGDGPPDIIDAHMDLPAGDYVIRWQVLAVDGHITRGDVPVSVGVVGAGATPVGVGAGATSVGVGAGATPVAGAR